MAQPEYRLLVVDDDPETSRLVRQWYRDGRHRIFDAPDGEQAIRLASREHPDLVLLDLEMPRMDGLETTRRLKEDPSTRNIPIILLSAHRQVKDKVAAFAAGADDYVTKPFAFDEVDARIRAMLRKRELYVELEETVEELRSTNEQLEELLVVDEKTGLANYRAFRRRLHEEFLRAERYGTPLALILFDLDDFKRLNDSLGHPAGDRALREIAALLTGGARATDLPARFGGEEFAILLPHTGGTMAARVAERVCRAVREYVFLEDESPARLTVSAGLATYPSTTGTDSPESLVEAADRALYRAKNLGKNRVVLDESLAETESLGS